ncbi:MAG: CotH kinase family protein [Clostridia bacterium]|nr:CotH kinase family protein [Clostridia bacterium]
MRRMLTVFVILIFLSAAALALCESFPERPAEEAERLEKRFRQMAASFTQPCVYITTEGKRPILSKSEYVSAVIDVFDGTEEHRLTATGGVKIRGNSTADMSDEKPYRIKFDKKQSMLGLHDGQAYKSWVLLRSQWNLAMDYTALNLARAIFNGRYYASDCMFVNLFINGEYKGIYVLCEQNQAAKGRIDVHEPKEGETGIEIGYLLELDNYPSDEHPYFSMGLGVIGYDLEGGHAYLPRRSYSVKSDLRSEAQFDFIRRYLTGVSRILYEASTNGRAMTLNAAHEAVPADGVYGTAFEAVSAVIDMESLADMVILEELTHNYDVGVGSFFMAVDFSEESLYPRLTFAFPWDFNWAYGGEPDGGYYAVTFQPIAAETDRSNAWMILAMRIPEFQALVKEKWSRLMESGVLEKALARVLADCEALRGDLGKDAWKISCAKDLLAFVHGRIGWLDRQWRQALP